jgi:molybdate transport system substrate-binding protein
VLGVKTALDDVDAAFTKQTGVKVVTSYDASSALMKQIESGAPADAFLSADLKWMDYGVEKKVINESTRLNLLGNVLVLIAAKDSKIDHVRPFYRVRTAIMNRAARTFDGDLPGVVPNNSARRVLTCADVLLGDLEVLTFLLYVCK